LARLLLVRHGETELNSSLRYWGSTDVALSELGLRQAERLRTRLATEHLDCVYSSDLKRSALTAKTIAFTRGLEVITCPKLREIDFGQIEGLTFDQISQFYPEIVRLWMEQAAELRYPGGESITELEYRVGLFRKRLDKHNRGETVLIVAHSGVLRTLACQLLNLEARQRWQMRLDLASVTIIDIHRKTVVLTALNDVSHLAKER